MSLYTFTKKTRTLLLLFAILGILGPNGLFLYNYFSNPQLIDEALANPISLAFLIEAMMLLVLFLGFIWNTTKSIRQVLLYLLFSILGSLAFSLPLFFYLNSIASPDSVRV